MEVKDEAKFQNRGIIYFYSDINSTNNFCHFLMSRLELTAH